ncbi:MAG: hypothetical protein WBI07_10895 [Mobilitalea sp.]
MEKILAVYDADIVYATRFMEYFKKKKNIDFEIAAFTKKESLLDFLKLHRTEILLFSEEEIIEDLAEGNVRYLYQLVETERKPKDIDLPQIYKYQPARQVMAEIMTDYIRRENIQAVGTVSGKAEIISIYSPISSCSKSYFAWSLAIMHSNQSKVLHIPLEIFPIKLLSQIDNSNQALSEFIYYLKENSNIIQHLNTLLNITDKLSYLSGISHGFDLTSLTKEDMIRWVEEMKLHTDYQTIIFSFSHYSEAMAELLRLSDKVYMIIEETTYEQAVLKEWEQQLEQIGIHSNQDKFIKVSVQQSEMNTSTGISLLELQKTSSWNAAAQYIREG